MKLNDLPSHEIPALDGNNAPVLSENFFDNLPVIGEVPTDLNGRYFFTVVVVVTLPGMTTVWPA